MYIYCVFFVYIYYFYTCIAYTSTCTVYIYTHTHLYALLYDVRPRPQLLVDDLQDLTGQAAYVYMCMYTYKMYKSVM